MKSIVNKNNFDGLRLISAILVLCSHQFALSGQFEIRAIAEHSFGNLGLLCFFTISGYLVIISWHKYPNPIRFTFRRFLRIAPGITLGYLLTQAVMILFPAMNNFPNNPLHAINGSLWTIPLEIYCYILLLTLGISTKKPALTFIAIIMPIWIITGGQTTTFYFAYFGLFFGVGAICAQYEIILSKKILIAMCILGIILIYNNQSIAGLVLFVPLVINIGLKSWFILKDAGHFGDLSYGVYIYAWPIQQVYIHWLGTDTSYIDLLSLSLFSTLLIAYCSWHLIEKKCIYMKPKTQSNDSLLCILRK